MTTRPASVYRFFGYDGQLLYVGMTENPAHRFASHMSCAVWRGLADPDRTTLEWYRSSADALSAEAAAIRAEQPLYNIDGTGRGRGASGSHFYAWTDLIKRVRSADIAALPGIGAPLAA